MLAKKPEQRHQTPAALMSDLASFSDRAGIGPLGTALAPTVVTRRPAESNIRQHMPWIVAAAVFLLVVLIIEAQSRSRDVQSMFLPMPDATNDAADVLPEPNEDDSSSDSGVNDAGGRNRGASNLAQGSSDPRNGNTERDAATSGQPVNSASQPSVRDNAEHPLRAEIGAAARGSARTANPRDVAKSTPDDSLSVTAAPVTERERAIADSPDSPATLPVTEPGVVRVAVAATADGRSTFASLDAAIEAAYEQLDDFDPVTGESLHDADTTIRVELRYNGPMPSGPLRISGANVDIAAGEGFSPVVRFASGGAAALGAQAMIVVADGELTIDRVAIEYAPAASSAATAALFEVDEADLVRLRDCSLTLSGPRMTSGSKGGPVFFAVAPGRPAAAMAMSPEMPEMNGAMPLLTIRLDRCVVRGEAGMVRVGGARNARLSWNNGLAVLGGPLLAVEGSRQQLPGAHVRGMLSHVTAALRGNLVAITNAQTSPFLPMVEVESYDGIFVGGDQPLVLSQGVDSIEDFRDRFRWKGERNFYDNWTRLWRIHGVGFESDPDDMAFRDWVTHWGRADSAPSLGPVIWRNPISLARAAHEQQLADFALADTDANPARASGEKGTDAGAQFAQLPEPPWRDEILAP
jgi:hypothetical protein